MSSAYYNKQWRGACSELENIKLNYEPAEDEPPLSDRREALQRLITLFIRYSKCFQSLDLCYDQVVHPQKNLALRVLLDAVMGRLVELKFGMIELEKSEYHFMDDIIADMELTPHDVQITVPRYYKYQRSEAYRKREKVLNDILERIGANTKEEKQKPKIPLEDAIQILQIHERARQGRLRAKFMWELSREDERRKVGAHAKHLLTEEQAAVKVQTRFRGFMARKRAQKIRAEELEFIGMTQNETAANDRTEQVKALRVEAERRIKLTQHQDQYSKALVDVKQNIHDTKGPYIREQLQDVIRQWFIECRDKSGKFPDYPSEEDGGSAKLFTEKTPDELEAELEAKENAKEAKGKKGKGKKEKKPKKGKGKGKGGGGEEEAPGWKMPPSEFFDHVEGQVKHHDTTWRNRDESNNFQQRHDTEIIKEAKLTEVESEIRVNVDEIMREELQNLKNALDKDKGKKAKKGKGKKGKKGKGKKGKKGKKSKDLTADRTPESLYQELITQGIIKKPENYMLDDLLGEFSYLGTTVQQLGKEGQPSIWDIRQLATIHGIVPLGSEYVHERGPLTKSLLITGPPGCGKRLLVHAICNEVGANLFDLSASNIFGKFPGKTGLNMLIHMVFKLAEIYQPSVIHIDNAEQTFYKKVPKAEKALDPKRLKKILPKQLKEIKKDKRILLIGTSSNPFEADMKAFMKVYDRVIMVPRPCYGDRRIIWTQYITRLIPITDCKLIDFSALAKVSDGYCSGQIIDVINRTLDETRLNLAKRKSVKGEEFMTLLALEEPLYKEKEDAYTAWYEKTPLGKKRKKLISPAEDGEGDGKDKKGKGKKKK